MMIHLTTPALLGPPHPHIVSMPTLHPSLFSQICSLSHPHLSHQQWKSSCCTSLYTITSHSRHHCSVQLGGHKHRPKWLLFMCAICCSVFITTILNLPTHSPSPSIKWAPTCEDRPQPSPTQPAYSALPDHILILSPLSSSTPTPQPPLTSASLTCLFWHIQPPHINLCIPTHIPTFPLLSILMPTPQPPSNSDMHNCIPILSRLSIPLLMP